ncbi:MAG: insulinase family protein [Selenomonadaceae bacterium]|nr:insulinase family protein [Selenomonadaceae bacterium]
MKINDVVHGFRLLKTQTIPEADSEGFEFVHEKTGARLFYLKNEDDNKVFSIAFRTPPTDDTGVAHIVEHSVLCGSRKYPLKEPFVELVKGSLNTFLNAMTYPDKTVYPVASRNDKDFRNLMDVYLDAVFYPAIYETPEILMQEGWHYEIEDAAEPLEYSGVVYNEMKGALSSPDDLLESRIMASLYPDTTYGYESGGDPEAIPSLTQEMFLEFHRKYYHPSNSYIYLYGDLDIDEKLAYLDGEYLSRFDRIPVPSHIERQKPFSEMKRLTEKYPCGAEEDTKEKTFLSLNYIVGDALDTEDLLGLDILNHAILRTPAGPLRRALVDAELGKDVDSDFEVDLLQPMLSIIINSSEKDRADKFYNVVMDTLRKLAKEGIDRTLMEASINLLEFRLRETDFGSAPKGLVYGLRSLRSWLYDGDPAAPLYYEDLLARMKKGLDDGFFEGLIEKYLLDNPHRTLLVMEPSKTMAAEREKAVRDLLASRKAELDTGALERIICDAKRLKERQQSPETEEALATIPLLYLSDIRKEPYEYPLEEREEAGAKILFSDMETNGIAYLNLYFDTSRVPQEKLFYLYLLADLIGSVSTKSHSYQELGKLQDLHTGGISYDAGVNTKKNEPDSFQPLFKVKAKALIGKLPELVSLLSEIFTESQFTDRKRVKELLEQTQVTIEMNMQRSAHSLVAGRIAGYLSRAGRYAEEGGLPMYRFIKDFLAHFDERFPALQSIMEELMEQVFHKKNLVVSVTLKEKDYPAFAGVLPKLVNGLSSKEFPSVEYHWNLERANEGLMSSSRVQYVGKGANFMKLGHPFTGSMHVLETLLRYDYFWTRIRVQGGAYGAFTNFSRNGMMFFGSYRDPNLKETLKVFDETVDYLKNFNVSDREMDKFIIGTMSNIDMPLTPKMKGNVAAECWLKGITLADRQKSRDQILSTRQQDIRDLAGTVEDCMKENNLCVFGNEEKLKENKECFGKLVPVME